MATAISGIKEEEQGADWEEFCNKQIKTATEEFFRAWHVFQIGNQVEVEKTDLIKKVSEQFTIHLEHCLNSDISNIVENKPQNGTTVRSASADDILEAASDEGPESPSPRIVHRPFFRRLSFKGLRKGKGLFLKQHSDEVELSPHHDKPNRSERHKIRILKVSAECIKEGTVQLLSGDTQEGRPHWSKTRMALVKVAAGSMIEFYSPPKNMKPCTGVFCHSIHQARETSDLEMPDLRNTFVLKAENGTEWVVDAQDQNDMKAWLTAIESQRTHLDQETSNSTSTCMPVHYNIKNESTLSLSNPNPTPAVAPTVPSSIALNTENTTEGNSNAPPDLPPRLPSRSPPSTAQASAMVARLNSLSRNSRSMNGTLGDSSGEDNDLVSPGGATNEGDVYSRLRDYPWFHGTMSRCDATSAVLQEATAGHGIFLVRQSQTRKGECVLTFNYQGRAKHLRITICPDGMCTVQHYTFPAIFELLEYFKENRIPLESGGSSDVTLTEYVIAPSFISRQQSLAQNSADRRVLEPPSNQELQTHGGSVRLTNALFQILQYEVNNSGGSTVRAVENTYTFT